MNLEIQEKIERCKRQLKTIEEHLGLVTDEKVSKINHHDILDDLKHLSIKLEHADIFLGDFLIGFNYITFEEWKKLYGKY